MTSVPNSMCLDLTSYVSIELYLGSVEDGRHREHGDDDEDVRTAAHVAGHNQHFGKGGVEGKLHHQTPSRCQCT